MLHKNLNLCPELLDHYTSLLAQIDANLDVSIALPLSARKLDKNFVPLYRSLQGSKSRPWTSLRSAVPALLRRTYYRSPLPRFFKWG